MLYRVFSRLKTKNNLLLAKTGVIRYSYTDNENINLNRIDLRYMPIIQSAKKRVKTADKATARNRKTKRSVKGAIKSLQASLAGDKKKANELIAQAQSEIDTAVKKGVLHKNKAARKKAQLAKAAKEAGVKPAKATAKKAAAKPVAKPAAKKPAAKKAPAKKPEAKK